MLNIPNEAYKLLSEGTDIQPEEIVQDQLDAISQFTPDDEDNANAIADAEPAVADGEDLVENTTHKKEITEIEMSSYEAILDKASEDVIVPATCKEYHRRINQFKGFCVSAGFIKDTNFDTVLFKKGGIPAQMPLWIALWIMSQCDKVDFSTGKAKGPQIARSTFSTAMKMRASISHYFSRICGLGIAAWTENPLAPGTFTGIPSVSSRVSQYMISLRRRKTRDGETAVSARAMDEATMKKLYAFNVTFADIPEVTKKLKRNRNRQDNDNGNDDPGKDWAGWSLRLMLTLLYITAFLCLLRFDEALRIEWRHVKFESWTSATGRKSMRVVISLPYRKTHQNGGIAPFYLYPIPDKPWLCPVTVWARFFKYVRSSSGGQATGFVFRQKVGTSFSSRPTDSMTSDSFMTCLTDNLVDISVDPKPYGTHSFRRGGTQWLALVKRVPYRHICSWAGWSDNLDNPTTLFKYLLSSADAEILGRQDFLNPTPRIVDPCATCGRTCPCT